MTKDILTKEELFILLIEECSEVIHAATKCLRFGWDRFEPGYGQNDIVLARELGDVIGIIDALPMSALNIAIMKENRRSKVSRVLAVKQQFAESTDENEKT